jgi:hypothetical protein
VIGRDVDEGKGRGGNREVSPFSVGGSRRRVQSPRRGFVAVALRRTRRKAAMERSKELAEGEP